MKPFIGILPSYDEEKKQIFLNQQYCDEVISSGGIPIVLPVTTDIFLIKEALESIDGMILSGGTDIDPKYYYKENTGKSKGITPMLDESENLYISIALDKNIPILGICRGMQALNVFCGGSLIEDIPSEYKTDTIHNLEKPKIAFHKVTVLPGNPVSDFMGSGEHLINSYHHQAVDMIAPYFSVAAISEDGIIEAIYRNDRRSVFGVQWHPERDHEKAVDNKKILDGFIKICSVK